MPRIGTLRLRPFRHSRKPHLTHVLPIPKHLRPLVGGVLRKYFRSEREGKAFLTELIRTRDNYGTRSAMLPEHRRVEAVRAMEILSSHPDWPLDRAARFVLDHLQKEKETTWTVADLMKHYAAFLEAKGGPEAAEHVRTALSKTRRFAEIFGHMDLKAVDARVVGRWLRVQATCERVVDGERVPCEWLPPKPLAAATVNGIRRYLRGAFSYALGQGHITKNPTDFSDPITERGKPVAIFTPDQMRALLQHAGELMAYFAIGGFAGLRPSEIVKIRWADIKGDHIDVDGNDPRSYARRWVTISPNLREWLVECAPAPEDLRYEGSCRDVMNSLVCPLTETQIKDRRYAAMEAAGIETWPTDVLRHSFCSYHLAEHQDLPRTMAEMGHSNARMIAAHYRNRVTPEAAHDWWNIKP